MKLFLLILILLTIALMVIRFREARDVKSLLLSIVTFGVVVAFTSLLPMFRTVLILYFAHLVLVVFAWGALFWFLVRGKLYGWVVVSPIVSVVLLVVIEAVVGAGG
jgi:hypothetical protein